MINWRTRPATVDDLDPLADLRAEVLRPDLERLGRFDPVRVRQRLRDHFDPAHTWIIEADGELVGSVALRPDGDERWLEHFYLAPAAQGGGIGSAVLRETLERAGTATAKLVVLRGSRAQRLYERHGFTTVDDDGVDVTMVRHAGQRSSPSRSPKRARSS